MKSGFCAILGRPNVGKSTLINALLSRKVSIVAPKAQTTRDDIMGIYNEKGLQIVFIDTPGMFEGQEALYKIMNKSARRSISDIDTVLYLIDVTTKDLAHDDKILASIKTDRSIYIVFNKIDEVTAPEMEKIVEHYSELFPNYKQLQISALTNFGLKDVKEAVASNLSEGPAFYPEEQVTDKGPDFMAKEVIREKILHFLKQEVPHQCAVMITEWKSNASSVKIRATIVTEKENQKAIVIGRGGDMIKKISMAARHELERLWKKHITLICDVECMPDWRNSPNKLMKLGYGDEQQEDEEY
ncbi:MAG: GTPase Era [Bacilli bacterium]|nr:GTPase Era [Bacilli bacterium]